MLSDLFESGEQRVPTQIVFFTDSMTYNLPMRKRRSTLLITGFTYTYGAYVTSVYVMLDVYTILTS